MNVHKQENPNNTIDKIVAYNPFDFVESCEPDCTPERHAYHQGQWDMAARICNHYETSYPNPVDGDDIPKNAKAQLTELIRQERISELIKLDDLFRQESKLYLTLDGGKVHDHLLDRVAQLKGNDND